MKVYIERADGRLARIVLPDEEYEGVWEAIECIYPTSYELIDVDMVLPSDGEYSWDISLEPGNDELLTAWLLGGDTYDGELADGAHIHADRREGIAAVIWTQDGREYVQTIYMNSLDYSAIAMGADPIAEHWEDGCGRTVCRANAEAVE